MFQYSEFIICNPKVLACKPILKGTRISVELIVRKFANGFTHEDLLKAYPHLKKEEISAALEYTADLNFN